MTLRSRSRNVSTNSKPSASKSHSIKLKISELTKNIVKVEEQKASLDTTEPLPAQGVVD